MTTGATIASLGGEFALIDRIAGGVAAAGSGVDGSPAVGIGDDAAVLAPTRGSDTQTIVTTDLLIEDVHFRRSYGDFYSLGVKAAAVNLSDIAAMGGKPTVAFISLALPKDTQVADLDELYRGMNETFARYGAMIAGGDTNLSPGPLTINVTLLGTVPVGKAVLRSTARPGDALLVTGALGAAAAGFALLEALGREGAEKVSPEAVRAQIRPVPRLAEAATAIASGGVTAMMDLSDGFMGDLAKLCRASGVGARVDADRVPVADMATRAAAALSRDPQVLALRGGEDYELLLTAAPDSASALCAAIQTATGTVATIVGTITAEAGVFLQGANGQPVEAPPGWDHFAS